MKKVKPQLVSELIYRSLKNEKGSREYRTCFENLMLQSREYSDILYQSDENILRKSEIEGRDKDWIARTELFQPLEEKVFPSEKLSLSELLLVTGFATVETRLTISDSIPDYNSKAWKFAHRFASHPSHAKAEYAYIALKRLEDMGLNQESAKRLINSELNQIINWHFE